MLTVHNNRTTKTEWISCSNARRDFSMEIIVDILAPKCLFFRLSLFFFFFGWMFFYLSWITIPESRCVYAFVCGTWGLSFVSQCDTTLAEAIIIRAVICMLMGMPTFLHQYQFVGLCCELVCVCVCVSCVTLLSVDRVLPCPKDQSVKTDLM